MLGDLEATIFFFLFFKKSGAVFHLNSNNDWSGIHFKIDKTLLAQNGFITVFHEQTFSGKKNTT